jgi:pimeloyl-ACP methyl ester carboxylesterase
MRKEKVSLHSLGDTLVGVLFLPESASPCPTLIVCPGGLMCKEIYFELSEFLAQKGVAALSMDMHGHGQSGGERFHVNMREWVADIRSALDFLANHTRVDSQKIGAWGHSSGGRAILEAALVDPRLKTLITLDATVRNSWGFLVALMFQALILVSRIKKLLTKQDLRFSMVKMFENIHVAADPEINRQLCTDPRFIEGFASFPLPGAAESFFVDTIKRVDRITIPTLVVWGENDELDPPESARLLYAALTCKKQLHIIPGNGHMGHLDRNKDQVLVLTAKWALENLK